VTGRDAGPTRSFGVARRVVVSFLAIALWGCAGDAARTEGARTALDEGIPNQALELLDEQLEVKGPSELPEKVSGDNALLLLDRA